jgi:predicted Zn-dependent protease
LWLWVLAFLAAAAALPLAAGPMALLLPESWESRLGEQVMATASVAPCLGGYGNRALDELASRLARPLTMKRAASIVVLPGRTRNAYALPGGKIIIYQGLIAAAPNAEALAGVLAHELAHLETKDPAAALLRAFMTRTLWTLLLGDLPAPSILISALMQGSHAAHYSRAQEWRADRRALELLAEADVDSSDLAEFLETLAKMQGRAPGMLHRVLASHPETDQRAALAREQASPGQPALGEGQWRAIRRLCDEAQNMSMR